MVTRVGKNVGVIAAAAVAVGGVFAVIALSVGHEAVAGEPAAVADQVLAKRQPSLLTQARTDCSPDSGSMGSLTEDHDGQVTLVIDGVGLDDTGYDEPQAEIDAVFCMLETVGAPADVSARVQDTRALDGMQNASWDGYTASWTYHPDSGLNLILTEK